MGNREGWRKRVVGLGRDRRRGGIEKDGEKGCGTGEERRRGGKG